MDITPRIPKGRKLITGYGGGGFKINHEFVAGSLIVCAEQVQAWNGEIEQLLETVNEWGQGAELLLVGTGASMQPLSPALRASFREKGISVDVMDTGAACRTFNVLLAEERKVAAAVLAV